MNTYISSLSMSYGLCEQERVMAAMSPNLQAILGLTKPPEGLTNKLGSGEEGSDINDWRPPPFAGLSNSKPVTTLSTLVVGQEKGLEVERRNRKEAEGESGSDGEEDEEWLEEEGWDYEGMQLVDPLFLSHALLLLFQNVTSSHSFLHMTCRKLNA